MNICVIASGYPSESKPILDIFIHEQAKEMVRQGHNVHVIAPGPSNEIRYEAINGVNVHRLFNPPMPPRLMLFVFCWKALRKAINLNKSSNFDVIHSHFADHAGLAGAIASKILGKPFVITSHGYDICYSEELRYGLAITWPMRLLVRFILKRADKILVGGQALKESLRKWGVHRQKISIINKGVNLVPSKRVVHKGKSNIILSVSNLLPIKNIDYMLEVVPFVLKEIPTAKYVIVGEGPERKKLERIVKEKQLENCVEFAGEVKNQELPRYYSEADVFVLPSIHEGFGIAKLEAYAFEVPVIVTNRGGAPEGVVDGKTGFIVPLNNPKVFADAIITLLRNSELRRSMGKQGRELVEKRYLWKYNVERLLTIYKDVQRNKHNR